MRVKIDAIEVLLSFMVAFIGSYLSISVCEQLRVNCGNFEQSKKIIFQRLGLLFMMTLSLGLVAIWSMHFIGMFSMSLVEPGTGNKVPVRYDLVETIFSLLIALVFSYLGFYFSHLDMFFGLSRKEILEIFIKEKLKTMTMQQVRAIGTLHILLYASLTSLKHIVMGGVSMGTGVVVMHYLGRCNCIPMMCIVKATEETVILLLGMAAMKFSGRIVWSPGVIFASAVLAIVASSAAFWIQFRLLSLFPASELLKLLSAFVMAVAVCAVHNTGTVVTCHLAANHTKAIIILL